MKKVSKAVIINTQEQYLLLQRNNHPVFGDDPDLPGGTGEPGESTAITMLREVYEETGLTIAEGQPQTLYAGTGYSQIGTYQALYLLRLDSAPNIVLSDEHSMYEWLDKDAFLRKALQSKDPYMHMVHDVITKNS